jgi:hypothetical protein
MRYIARCERWGDDCQYFWVYEIQGVFLIVGTLEEIRCDPSIKTREDLERVLKDHSLNVAQWIESSDLADKPQGGEAPLDYDRRLAALTELNKGTGSFLYTVSGGLPSLGKRK